MRNDDKYKGIFMSRIMPCKKCLELGWPQKGQLFITFGGKSQKYKIHKLRQDVPHKNVGLTPHFIQALGLNKTDDGVVIIANCCIHGCDINLTWNEKEGRYDIHFANVNAMVLPIKDWEALLFRWHHGTGLELD